MKIYLSPSKLEKFRDVASEKFGATPNDFKAYCMGVSETSEAMARGSAYHRVLELGDNAGFVDGEWRMVSEAGFNFRFHSNACKPALGLHDSYTEMIKEMWLRWGCSVNGYDVEMRMRADGMDGLHLHEFKTTGSQKSWLDYFGSLQWRCYCLAMPDLQKVIYHIFQFGTNNDWCKYQTFEYLPEPYEEMERMVKNTIAGLINWSEGDTDLMDALTKAKR